MVVEAGPIIRATEYRREVGHTMTRYFWDGGMRMARGNAFMPTVQARCLGGGSVFNSAICLRAPQFALQSWERDHGIPGLGSGALDRHYEAIERFQRVRTTRPEVQGARNELFAEACAAMGYKGLPTPRNEEDCQGSAECLTGCPTRAKQSMDVRGLPEILEADGRLYTSVTIDRLLRHGSRVRGAEGWVLDPITRDRTVRFRCTAAVTVLAAGAIHSPVILQRSGFDRDPIGSNLRFHPGTSIAGVFDDDVNPWSGATQGMHCLDFMERGIKLETLWADPALLSFRFPGFGAELKGMFEQYRKMAMWCLWVSGEDSAGRVRALPGGRPDVAYSVQPGDVARMKVGMALLTEMFFAVGARSVVLGTHGLDPVYHDRRAVDALRAAEISPGSMLMASNHVFGSMAMGADLQRHAVDPSGAAYEIDDLYIADTGILPATPAANPMLTLMALADRIGETMAARY